MGKMVGYSEYKELLGDFINIVKNTLGDQVISIILYGSVARGTAKTDSDVDLLLILKEAAPQYWKRLQPFFSILKEMKKQQSWEKLENQGITPSLNLLLLSLEEAKENRYLYMDMIEEAVILVDTDGFFQGRLESFRQRLEHLGARKVKREGDWFWELKPDLKPEEKIFL